MGSAEGTLASRGRVAAPAFVVGAAAAAWLGLWWWEASGQGEYLHHEGLADSALPPLEVVAVFVAGWVLMLVATMLPSTWALVSLFSRVVARRPDRGLLLAALLGGYLAVWVGAGFVALAGDSALHEVVHQWGWLEEREWLITAAALALAGGYQLSALKYRCLDGCRSPRMAIMTAWRGLQPAKEALALGVQHGRFCVGCCWALMVVMFANGLGRLAWMLGLAAVMTAEKTAPWGPRIGRPVGAALLGAAVLVGGVNVV